MDKHHDEQNPTRIPFANGKVVHFIPHRDIVYIKASGNYSEVFFQDGKKLLVTQCMKDVESLLVQKLFCRIHNSYLINLEHLSQYQKGEGGFVIMCDGARLPVSKRKKEALMKLVRLG